MCAKVCVESVGEVAGHTLTKFKQVYVLSIQICVVTGCAHSVVRDISIKEVISREQCCHDSCQTIYFI